jgi:hypothetical protein
MIINEKNVYIDVDRSKVLNAPNSTEEIILSGFKNTEYLIKATLVASSSNSNAFSLTSTCDYVAALGILYGSNASPVVTVSASNAFNQVTDWSLADSTNGKICFRLPTNGSTLINDMANSASKTYYMEIWAINDNDESVLLSHSPFIINNVAVEMP